MTFYLFLIGFVSILGQVVILRELNVAFFGIELIYLLAVGIWLFWTGTGALIGRRSFLPSPLQITLLCIVFGIVLPLDVAYIRAVRLLFSGVPGAYLPFPQQVISMVIALFPIGLLLGVLFQWAAKLYVTGEGTLASAYAIESIGGVLGGLFATLALKFGVQNFTIATLCGLLSVCAGYFHFEDRAGRGFRKAVPPLIILLLLVWWMAPTIDRAMTTWNHPHLLDTRDSPYGRVSLTELSGQISLFENDALAFETEGTAAEEFAHLAALQHPDPTDVLLLGGGIEGIVRELRYHSPHRIDYVELNRVILDLVVEHLPGDIRKSLRRKNVHIYVADPRVFLTNRPMTFATSEVVIQKENKLLIRRPPAPKYDLILIGMPEPTSGQNNRFYTREFFEACSARLNPGGRLALRLRSSENLWTPHLIRRTASIHLALKSVFPEVLILPGVTNIVIASHQPIVHDPRVLADRLRERNIHSRLIIPEYINYLYTNDRFYKIKEILAVEEAPVNSDVRPICYQYAIMIWLSKFFPILAAMDLSGAVMSGSRSYWLLLLLCIPALFLLSRRWPSFRRVLLAGMAGFVGMVLETTLILHYQVKSGVLYQDLGILLMVFMLGLTVGSWSIKEMAKRPHCGRFVTRWMGAAMLVGFCLINILIAWQVDAGYQTGLPTVSFMLMVTGALVGGLFGYVSLHRVEDQVKVVSPLYSADLLGGCIGSVIASLVLIPMAGLVNTAGVMAVLSIVALILL